MRLAQDSQKNVGTLIRLQKQLPALNDNALMILLQTLIALAVLLKLDAKQKEMAASNLPLPARPIMEPNPVAQTSLGAMANRGVGTLLLPLTLRPAKIRPARTTPSP